MVAPGWAKRSPESAIGSPARMRSSVDLPAPLRPTRQRRSPGAMPSSTPSSITWEINLPRAGADRRVAGIIAADEKGALYLAHSGRMGGARTGQRKAGFRGFLADGVWRRLVWPDGTESEALIVAPLDSPRLTRLLGLFVDAVRRF